MSRTAELARRRERRGRSLRLLAIGLLLIGLGLLAGYRFWLRDSSLVAIRHLTVKGLASDDRQREPIAEAVRLAVDQMTTLHPQPGLLTSELTRFPRVARAELETSIPNSATVRLRLRRDGSRAGSGASERLIATDGTVLGPIGDLGADLPRIQAPGAVPDRGRLTGKALAQALVLGGAPEKLRPYVDSGRSGPDGVEVTLSNGLVLGFGDPVAIGLKWKAAAAVIADPGVAGASYVDLSVPRRPAVRRPGGAPAATETEPQATATGPTGEQPPPLP